MHVWRVVAWETIANVTGNKEWTTCSYTLRQCNAHYNNFQYENPLAVGNDNSMATLFNSLKVHINKTTCARVLSVNAYTTSQPCHCFCAHSKLITLPFHAWLGLAIMSSFFPLAHSPSRLIARPKNWKRRGEKNLN